MKNVNAAPLPRARPCGIALILTLVAAGTPFATAQAVSPRSAAEADPIVLSPFEVTEDARDTYDAANTNSVTGTNMSLEKTPLDAKVFNQAMMEELGIVDITEMLVDFAGLGTPFVGGGSQDQSGLQAGDAISYSSLSSRGLQASNPRRDGFLRSNNSLADSYDIERTEVVQGSNSLLFGSGDAGGVIVVSSKRGRLNQRFAKLNATFDTEGTTRYTTDINAGTNTVAVRVNAVKGDTRFYRPVLRLGQEGIQVAPIVKPVKWLTISGEYRHYERALIRAGNPRETVRAPTNLLLDTGERLDNQVVRYITGLGGSALLDNFITLRNQDSVSGAFKRHHYRIEGKAIAVEASASRDLHFQFRFGTDKQDNNNVTPSNTVIYHPNATGNAHPVDAGGNRPWAFQSRPHMASTAPSARGYKLTAVYHRDIGRWGDHWINAFISGQDTMNNNTQWRHYELDANGEFIQNPSLISAAQAGRTLMPVAWTPLFPTKIYDRYSWPAATIVHPNGKTYKIAPMTYEGAVAPTAGNPLGLSGPINAATGASTDTNYRRTKVREKSTALSASSEFWRGRINTLLGFRFDQADTFNFVSGERNGPIDYNSTTLGAVARTPIDGIRVYAAYATNANPNFSSATTIHNELLPIAKGVSKEAGLKFSMWNHRLSGNLTYYITEGRNFSASLGGFRDQVDPEGINGRNGGGSYTFSKTSDGIDLRLSIRPIKPWQVTVNYSEANGSERSNVTLPIFYNDEFNTTNVGGQIVVGVRHPTTGAVSPLMVPGDPANPASAQVPLSINMMKDRNSPYFAVLDADSGQILNTASLGLITSGVGTGRTGVAISNHQLGFTPPSPVAIVRRAGEKTTGYAEHAFSIINRYQFSEGRLRGLVLGVTTVYNTKFRGYRYTDAANNNERKTYYYPDRFENRLFAIYNFRPARKVRVSVRLNVSNLFDNQTVLTLPRSTNGTIAAFANQYDRRKGAITTAIEF